MPRLLHGALADDRVARIERALEELAALQRRRNRLMGFALVLLAMTIAWAAFLSLA